MNSLEIQDVVLSNKYLAIEMTEAGIKEYWDQIEPMLDRAASRSQGMLTTESLIQALMSNRASALATVRSGKIELFLIVDLVIYSCYSSVRILVCVGKGLRDAMQFINALEAWALTKGAVEIEGWCRPAMVRLTKRLGWHSKVTLMTRDLRGKLQ